MSHAIITTPQFEPDYAIPPGETLREAIESLGMSQKELATRLDMSEKHINQLIHGKAPLSYELASRLELVTGIPARLWNSLEATYRGHQKRIEAMEPNIEDLAWLKSVPTKELIKRGKIQKASEKATLLAHTLQFFGVSSSSAWQSIWMSPKAAFRKSPCFESMPAVTATWLRLAEIEAIGVQCESYDAARFREALSEIRKLTLSAPSYFQPRMQTLCAAAGVAVVFVPELKGCPASGAAWWLTSAKAIIALSLRHRTEDHLWFSYFHEAGHVLNDPKGIGFVDDGCSGEDERESRANRFAADMLIPRTHIDELQSLKSKATVQAFAKQLGISPGIVVGRLQHEKHLPYTHMNDLKTRLEWRDRQGG